MAHTNDLIYSCTPGSYSEPRPLPQSDGNKAINMMKKMGFVVGQGLGKDLQGVAAPLGSHISYLLSLLLTKFYRNPGIC